MPQLQSVLQSNPQTLRNYVAQGENWQNPAAGFDAANSLPLKLYQPVQARFYIIASSLTCRIPGLPDHSINKPAGETVAFVVRQLRPNPGFTAADCAVYNPLQCTEYAWIPGDQPVWSAVSGPTPAPVAGEEQIPLSPALTGSNGTSRRVLTGLIPASRRQQYIGANTAGNGTGSTASAGGNALTSDPRMQLFQRQVMATWINLNIWWNKELEPADQADPNNQASAEQSSALILLDFANFLITYLSAAWNAFQDSSQVPSLTPAEAAFYHQLGPALIEALVAAKKFELQFESAGPATTFPPPGYTPYSLVDPANSLHPSTLKQPLYAALPALSSLSPAPPSLPPIAQNPANPQGDFYFIVRCVYSRPQCKQIIVSQPSQPFLLASYFDSDALARRIQVALPVDTSAAALRKYDKGVVFMISDELRNQMARFQSLKQMTDGPPGAPGVGIGMICSFSIPIITICALILLLVIVIALNIVFFWLPFFKICFPVPTLKGKG